MTASQTYTPSPIGVAQVRKEGEKWELILTRELRHSPAQVWQALTDPAELCQWAPFESSGNMGATGATVKLTTVGAPSPHIVETKIVRAENSANGAKVLEYSWSGNQMRWELEPSGTGTRLTLWTTIDRRWISMGASGWHVCFDVLDRLLSGNPLGRIAGPETMKLPAFQQLNAAYARQFGVELPSWAAPKP